MAWYKREKIEVGSLVTKEDSKSLADGESITFPSAIEGRGKIWISDNSEKADFYFSKAGAVTLENETSGIVASNTASKLCVYDSGTSIKILNNTGNEITVNYSVKYNS